mmetsp:Transcript_38486/g.80712  ORF Transcript_38486/g.80712 Transcript_38486/m.80712 type:complete len:80 (-) Transcript_38486:126-365(-)
MSRYFYKFQVPTLPQLPVFVDIRFNKTIKLKFSSNPSIPETIVVPFQQVLLAWIWSTLVLGPPECSSWSEWVGLECMEE